MSYHHCRLAFQAAPEDHWEPTVADGDYEGEGRRCQTGETTLSSETELCFPLQCWCVLAFLTQFECSVCLQGVCFSVCVATWGQSRDPLSWFGVHWRGAAVVSWSQPHPRSILCPTVHRSRNAKKGHTTANIVFPNSFIIIMSLKSVKLGPYSKFSYK